MKKLSLFILVLFSLLVVSCNKFVYKYNSDFEGTWLTIPIYDSGLSTYVQSRIVIDGKEGSFLNACQPCGTDLCSCMNEQFGKAVINSTYDQMRIGSGNYPLTIDKEPYFDDTVWVMKIHGQTYYKQ